MKINYIRITASAIVLLANAICVNTKETDATTSEHAGIIMQQAKQKTYKTNNTIIPLKARIILP